MRVLIAPQEFKGTLTAREAAEAMAAGARRALPDARIQAIPLSDGGPGFIDVLLASTPGRRMQNRVQDPLGRLVDAAWAILDETAVIESAAASGLVLLLEDERNPAITSSYGVGQLVLAALDAGCRRIIVGLGGSATNDGGAGMAAALGARFLNAAGRDLPPGGAALAGLARIDVSALDPRLEPAEIIAAADVNNPLCGPDGASLVYAPQKGASPALAQELDAALRRYAECIERDLGISVFNRLSAGAAGGVGAGLIAFAGASVWPGFGVVSRFAQLPERVNDADLLITGEGRLDGQTAFGKAVWEISNMAAGGGIPVLVVPGALGPGWEAILPYVDGVEPIVGSAATEHQVYERPAEFLSRTVERALRGWRRMRAISAEE